MLRSPAPPPTVSDADLLARFQAGGDPDDLLPLYARHAPLIYALCLRYLGTPTRAEDAGMEIWSVLHEKLPRHEVTNFRAWLQTTVRNHCLMQLRREKRDPLAAPAPDFMQFADLTHPNPEHEEPAADTRGLYHCLKKLKPAQRRCVKLFYLQSGYSYQDVATDMDLTVGQVRSHLQNGRRNLKICLESHPDLQATTLP